MQGTINGYLMSKNNQKFCSSPRSGTSSKSRKSLSFIKNYGAWKNHISHGNCYRLGKRMDEKVKGILDGETT